MSGAQRGRTGRQEHVSEINCEATGSLHWLSDGGGQSRRGKASREKLCQNLRVKFLYERYHVAKLDILFKLAMLTEGRDDIAALLVNKHGKVFC